MTAATATLSRETIALAYALVPYLPAHDGLSYDGKRAVRYAAFGPRLDVETADGEVELETMEEYDALVASGAEVRKVTVYMYAVKDRANNDELLAEIGGVDSPKLKGLAEASDFWPEATFVA